MTIDEAESILQEVRYWHYPFDLPKGTTVPNRPGVDPKRHLLRKRHFFDRLVARYSGSLSGKAVLDLGCCQGFWSFHASRAGAINCVGIDSSQTFVREAQAIGTVVGIYHLVDPIFVLRRAASLTLETLVVDTEVLREDGSFLSLAARNPEEPTTCGSNLVCMLRVVPTRGALLSLISATCGLMFSSATPPPTRVYCSHNPHPASPGCFRRYLSRHPPNLYRQRFENVDFVIRRTITAARRD
jgi:hypothetical protein